MTPHPPAPLRRAFLGAMAVLALVLLGALAWWHGRTPVATRDIEMFLDRAEGGGRLRFTVDNVAKLRQQDGELQLGVAATARTVVPLYTRVDTADYLRRTFQLDRDQAAEARRLLGEKAPAAGAGPLPADPFGSEILRLSVPAETPFVFQGVISARKGGGEWSISLLSGGFAGSAPQGDARSFFGAAAYVERDPADEARLRAAAADFQDFAARVSGPGRQRDRAVSVAAEGRKKAFLEWIAPGRVFRGQAIEAGEQQGTTLYLEIADVADDGGVTALLRNEGSWHLARTFQGTWSADNAFDSPVLNLSSPPDQAVRNAGPVLENSQTWAFALRVDQQGSLTEQNRLYQYRFQPLGAEQVGAAKARLEAEYTRAVSATEPGMLYQGTAVFRATGASEAILLRFAARADGRQSVRAQLESTTRSWKRPLHGMILGNSRRSGGEPIRLQSAGSDAVEDAASNSVMGDRDDLDLHLGLEGASLVGADSAYTYQLAPAGEADLQKLEADRVERARAFRNIVRSGIEYDGVLREEQGYIGRARLEIARVDPQTGAVAARLASLSRPNVYRDFIGTCDPSGSMLILVGTGKGSFDASGEFDIPVLISPSAATLHLALVGSSLVGNIEGNPHWAMEFSAAPFLTVPTEGAELDSTPAIRAVFPAFPKEAGAYLLSRGAWVALPHNNGHVVVEKLKDDSSLELPGNVVDALSKGIEALTKKTEKKKVSYLDFDGKEPLPAATGSALVLFLAGASLRGNSVIELAPTDVQKEGLRRIQIASGSPGRIDFGDQRVAAYVRQIAPGQILMSTTAVLAPGPYALNAEGTYELREDQGTND